MFCVDVLATFTCTMLMLAFLVLMFVFTLFLSFLSGPDHVAESTEGLCPVHLAAYCARVRV